MFDSASVMADLMTKFPLNSDVLSCLSIFNLVKKNNSGKER